MTDYARIIEGLCPHNDHGPLKRRDDDHGWCDTCQIGWARRGDVITASVPIRFFGGSHPMAAHTSIWLRPPTPDQ